MTQASSTSDGTNCIWPSRLLERRQWLQAAFTFYTAMLALASLPDEAALAFSLVPDKLLHFIAYAVLTMLLFFGISGSFAARVTQVITLVTLLGALDEAIRHLLPYRSADLRDWEIDMIAASAVLISVGAVKRLRAPLGGGRAAPAPYTAPRRTNRASDRQC